MRITMKSKRLQISLLLCFLLLLEYINFGIFSSARISSSGVSGYNMASSGGANRHSSMSDSVYAGLNLLTAFQEAARFSMAPAGKWRGPSDKNNYVSSAAVSASHIAGLISYLRLSQEIYNQFDSVQITAFLHKKDGMKGNNQA